eukprot:2617138-Heterocapsa_arctica.AAC.1
MTILPWANNLNKGRCKYCYTIDHHDICPIGAKCRVCSQPLIRAQEELVIYDATVDNTARGIGAEGRSLYVDVPPSTPADDKPRT